MINTDDKPFESMTLSEARHSLNLLPKRFENNPDPIMVEQHGKIVMAIISKEDLYYFSSVQEFMHEKNLLDELEEWLKEEGALLDDEDDDETFIKEIQQGMLADPEFRKEYIATLKGKIQELENMES